MNKIKLKILKAMAEQWTRKILYNFKNNKEFKIIFKYEII